MQKAWTPPVRLVFGAATLLGIFSTLQAYRLIDAQHQRPDEHRGVAPAGAEPRLLVRARVADVAHLPYRPSLPDRLGPVAARARRPCARRGGVLGAAPRLHGRASLRAVAWHVPSVVCSRGRFLPVRSARPPHESRLGADDVRRHRRIELRAGVLPRVAGPRAQGGAARDQPGRGAVENARGRAPSAFPVQHASRDLVAHPHPAGLGRPHDQPPQRSAAHHVRPLGGGARAAAGGARVPAEVPGDRADAVSGSAHGQVRDRSGDARRRGAAPDPSAAGRERDQARRGAAQRSGHDSHLVAARRRRPAPRGARQRGRPHRRRAREAARRRGSVEHAGPPRMPVRRRARAGVLRSGPRADRRDALSLSPRLRRAPTRLRPGWHDGQLLGQDAGPDRGRRAARARTAALAARPRGLDRSRRGMPRRHRPRSPRSRSCSPTWSFSTCRCPAPPAST